MTSAAGVWNGGRRGRLFGVGGRRLRRLGLREVLDETAQAAFDDATEEASDAARLLKQAWRPTFKRDPDYSTGGLEGRAGG